MFRLLMVSSWLMLRDRRFLACLILMLATFLFCTCMPNSLYDSMRPTLLQNELTALQQLDTTQFTDEQAQLVSQDKALLLTLVEQNVFESPDFSALAKHYRLQAELSRAWGSAQDVAIYRVSEGEALYFEKLASLGAPKLYTTSTELPALLALSYVPSLIPIYILFAPACLCVLIASELFSLQKLLALAPANPESRTTACALCALVGTSIILLASFAVIAVVQTAVAGIGEAAYPVVIHQGDLLLTLPAIEVALMTIILIILANWVVVLFGVCAASLSTKRMVVPLVSLIMAAVFSLDFWADIANEYESAWILFPALYCRPNSVVGTAGAVPGTMGGSNLNLSVAQALTCQIAWVALLFAISYIRARLTMRAWKKLPQLDLPTEGLVTYKLEVSVNDKVLLQLPSLKILPGKFIALVAPNGYGKTSLMRALAGTSSYVHPCHIQADGIPYMQCAAYLSKVFWAPGEELLLPDYVLAKEAISLCKYLWHSKLDVAESMHALGADAFATKPLGSLSRGMKQQVMIAMADISAASYLLLDEPINALDPLRAAQAEKRMRTLVQNGRSILMSTHILHRLPGLVDSAYAIANTSLAPFDLEDDPCQTFMKRYEKTNEKE